MAAIFKCIFLNGNVCILIKMSLKFVANGPINSIPAMVQIMSWRRLGDKPLSEPMLVRLPAHICVPTFGIKCLQWTWTKIYIVKTPVDGNQCTFYFMSLYEIPTVSVNNNTVKYATYNIVLRLHAYVYMNFVCSRQGCVILSVPLQFYHAQGDHDRLHICMHVNQAYQIILDRYFTHYQQCN